MGIPEMEEFRVKPETKVESGTASEAEEKLYRKIGKALVLLADNPRCPGLNSHEVSSLTARYGQKVWERY